MEQKRTQIPQRIPNNAVSLDAVLPYVKWSARMWGFQMSNIRNDNNVLRLSYPATLWKSAESGNATLEICIFVYLLSNKSIIVIKHLNVAFQDDFREVA
jgi:hypothetical protein